MSATPAAALTAFIAAHPRLVVLTGAGCSTASGIPDYRDASGAWKPGPPVLAQDFLTRQAARQRYWSRSIVGWPRFRAAQPNPAHHALAALEAAGRVTQLITQNVDGLHQCAGSACVSELHGTLARVRCLGCGLLLARDAVQVMLEAANPDFAAGQATAAPDGDAHVDRPAAAFVVPACPHCGGLLKPDVVFFGESVPREVVATCTRALDHADALLCVGTSLMVYSGFRFCRHAAASGKPVAALNLGATRADDLLAHKFAAPCAETLQAAVGLLGIQTDAERSW